MQKKKKLKKSDCVVGTNDELERKGGRKEGGEVYNYLNSLEYNN
jgi:hypothetical protein